MGLLGNLIGPNVDKLAARGDVEGLVRVLAGQGGAEGRARAAAALAVTADPRALPALTAALADGEAVVAAAAEAGLRRLGVEAASGLAGVLEHADESVAARARSLLLELGGAVVGTLVAAARTGGDAGRERAVSALGEVYPGLGEEGSRDEVFRALLAALGDRLAATRARAADLLGEIADPRAGRALAARLKDGDAGVREASVRALRRLGGRAVPCLVEAFRDRNPNSRRAAARLLGEVGLEAADRVTRADLEDAARAAVDDRDPEVRDAAAAILSRLPEDEVGEGEAGENEGDETLTHR
jgi:HEAT repeat protein